MKKQTKKEKQAAKDPNKPKRAASAFFVFMYADFVLNLSSFSEATQSVAICN